MPAQAFIMGNGAAYQLMLDRVSVERGGKKIVNSVSLQIDGGDFVAILGPNGAGKTSLLRAIAGLQEYTGSIAINGRDLPSISFKSRSQMIAYIPQNRQVEWPLSVREIIALGRIPHGAFSHTLSPADELAIMQALKDCALEELEFRAADTLSGGELARALIARAFATEAQILLADEPTSSLDPRHRYDALKLMQDHARDERVCITVTHDIDLAARLANKIVVMHEGSIIAQGGASEIFESKVLDKVFGLKFGLVDIDGQNILVTEGY